MTEWRAAGSFVHEKSGHETNGDFSRKRTIACAFCVRARVCLFIRETSFLIHAAKEFAAEELRMRSAPHESAALSRKKTRYDTNLRSLCRESRRAKRWITDESVITPFLMISYVYRKWERISPSEDHTMTKYSDLNNSLKNRIDSFASLSIVKKSTHYFY